MSDSEDNFGFMDGGSDESDFAPKPKAKATATKASTTKVTKKPAATKPTKKKAAASADENVDPLESENKWADQDEEMSDGVEDATAAAKKAKKTASEMYQQLTPVEHILKRPDSYIGSVETITEKLWVYDTENKRMVYRDVKYVPGFFKIVDEILVNAADNKINDSNMDTLKVTIDTETNTISVWNNGRGIPIEIHSKTKIYIPEMIFGNLLTSSNYDDDEKKLTGGRNGYGAKLTNIYSTEFVVETADKKTSQKYKQTFTKNMGHKTAPKITKNAKGDEFTCITFKPDLARFGMTEIDEDTEALLKKRVYDMAGTVKDIKVLLNNERVKVKNFKSYCELYLAGAAAEAAENGAGAATAKPTLIYEEINSRWEVAFALSESGNFQQVSFANSIATIKGGTHVNCIADQIIKGLIAQIEKKNKAAKVKPLQIRNHMWIFVRSLIENPTFDSQTKETLTLPASRFGGKKPTPTEDFMKKVLKSGIIDTVLTWAKFKADQEIKKTDGNKRVRLTGLTKLSDANNAGTKNAHRCTLILTEGDSAKAFAEAGLSVVGRDNFGVFPLRGKPLNVREATHEQVMKNLEITNVKQILGLQHGKTYTDTSKLRYGKVMIMTDQDHDGSHIKGLLINLFDHFFPSLLRIPGFLLEFVTPIVRVTKGKQKLNFFTLPEFYRWNEENNPDSKWTIKYYKGLGTSEDNDAMDYFSNTAKHVIPFSPVEAEHRDLIDMAFSKKRAEDRKEWLRGFKPGTFIDHDVDEINIPEFINKELICYSMADNIRSIPSVVDGFKPGQRKVVFGCFKRKLRSELKVSQLIGYIGEKTSYHHGEASLASTIVNLAQTFVGSNNMNLLSPNGQYGTRATGGKDHASPRYIFTMPTPLARSLLHPADDALLTYLEDDGLSIEPEWYVPVIPLILVNGADGIGTGWSTTIPNYNPKDIVSNIRRLLRNEPQEPMTPWYRGFRGTIDKTGEGKYQVNGIVKQIDDTTFDVTELPIQVWTQNYKEQLEKWVAGTDKEPPYIKDYKEYHTNTTVHFSISMTKEGLAKVKEEGMIKFFKCTSPLSATNMMAFDANAKLRKYATPEEIIEDFFALRLSYYQKRKDFLCNELRNQWEKISNQARFVQMIIDKKLVIAKRKKADLVVELRKLEFRAFSKVSKAKVAGEDEPAMSDDDEADSGPSATTSSDYDYLLGMAIWSLTEEKVAKLLKERDGKEAELNILLAVKPSDIWENDLDRVVTDFEELLVADTFATNKASKGKRAAATVKTRKSLTNGRSKKNVDSDSEDDFKPSKLIAPKKALDKTALPKPRALAKAKAILDDDDDDDKDEVKPPVRARVGKAKAESDLEVPVMASRKVSGKKPALPDSDSDVEMATAAAAKGGAKKTTKRKSWDSEGESDEKPPAPAKKAKTLDKKQAGLTDFFESGPSKPKISAALKPKPAPVKKTIPMSDDEAPVKKKLAPKKKAKASESESDDVEEVKPTTARAPKRAAAPAKMKYADTDSESDVAPKKKKAAGDSSDGLDWDD